MTDLIPLGGKRVLVTGAGRGIGRGLALTLAASGAHVLACYRGGGEHIDSLAVRLKETPGDHHLIQADVTDAEDVQRLLEEARTRFGGLDGLVNNAGVISHIPFEELPYEEWSRVLDTNLGAVFRLTQQALPLFGERASVVNIGSRAATVGIPLRGHYTAAKAGLIGLTRSLAKELGGRGVRVNVVAPGVIATEAELPQAVVDKYSGLTAVGRLGRTEEIAHAAAFLLSDLSSYITGETLHVDGGI
ncbi:3-oxoacyl-ACP reductase family protein [Streptomyces sp. MST-110588]|uniref:SDR family NAD(P)-dependent oxidoreductase n=1 Tax=Streptomyces sp. MST-110588 TaxID=2833628 RepID=UPI001F5DD09A|nr:3-oxoacyl-ACP reductase family protein [Streptomyces sp. MST-110588]UNO40776.1 3-oxoacyl-ACP reductase FabG [Streptomyces sp. MST-110588]